MSVKHPVDGSVTIPKTTQISLKHLLQKFFYKRRTRNKDYIFLGLIYKKMKRENRILLYMYCIHTVFDRMKT